MKTKSIYIGLIGICSLLFSCDRETIRASNTVTTEEVNFSDYSGLRISNAFNAYVTFSDTEEKIEIEANENLHDYIIVAKERNTLVVKFRRNTNLRGNVTLNIYISTGNITNFDVSGASSITLENELVSQNTSIELSGASNFYGEISTSRLELDARGASGIDIFGSTDHLDASLEGSSGLRDYDLAVKHLDIRLSGASDAYLSVAETLDISASGASALNYKGDAAIGRKKLSGASQIIKK